MKRLIPFLLLLLIACEGPVGPEGPPGPQGERGETGPSAQSVSYTGRLDDEGTGGVSIEDTHIQDIAANCWMSQRGEVWLLLGTDLDGPTCGAIQDGNDLVIAIVDGVPDWHYLIVVIGMVE